MIETTYYTHKYGVDSRLTVRVVSMKGALEYVVSMGDKLGDYVNCWIAVVDDKIIAKGDSAKEVFFKAKKLHPDKIPFVMKVPADTVMLM